MMGGIGRGKQCSGAEWEQTDQTSNLESSVPSENQLTFLLICRFQILKIEIMPSARAQHRVAVKILFNHSFTYFKNTEPLLSDQALS